MAELTRPQEVQEALRPPGAPPTVTAAPPARAVRVRPRAAAMLGLTAVAGLLAFCWPLFVDPASPVVGNAQAPFLFALILPLVIAVVLTELSGEGMDVKALAMLGVLSAVGAGLRLLGAGTAGVQPLFFLLVVAGRVFGPGFGFVLGNTVLLASSVITGGFGPWLPFQMIAAGFVGMVPGLLPPVRGRVEVWVLAAYGLASGFGYGLLMNLYFWPFTAGYGTGLAYDPAASAVENVQTLVLYTLATSMAFDLGRGLTTAVLVVLAGPGLLVVLRRAARRARFTEE